MLLARVAGTVVASRKEPRIAGSKMLLLSTVDVDGNQTRGSVVAVDSVGAGIGEIVLYATGSSARQTELTHERPVDAVVMAIVDTWEVGGEVRYRK
jgi:microcompartment protein CcmK/EutM